MTAYTAKAIKEIVDLIRCHCSPHQEDDFAAELERALIRFAEGIKTDAIEP